MIASEMPKKRRVHKLTEANRLKRYPASMVNFCWFTDEKIFTVAVPSNSQNDCLYAAVAVCKKSISAVRLLHTRPTISKSVMVSVGVSVLGRTNLHFVDPGIKILLRFITYERSSARY